LLEGVNQHAQSAPAPRVVVVSENPETVDGLQTYFVGVGITAQSVRTLDATASLPERTTAVVVFPDGFGPTMSSAASRRSTRSGRALAPARDTRPATLFGSAR